MDIGLVNNIKSGARIEATVATAPTTSPPAAIPSSSTVLTENAVQQTVAAPSEGQVNQALQRINKALQRLSPDLEFELDPDTNRAIVKVIDQQTKEVIRQMPTAEALEISKALDKLQGLLVRQKA